MNSVRFSTIAHQDHTFYSPLSGGRADQIIELLRLDPGNRVLDVGCGRGEFPLRIAARYGARTVGVDLNPDFLRMAEEAARHRGLSHLVEWHATPAAEFPAPPESFQLTLCIGSTHALGGLKPALAALARWTSPGGMVLVAHGHWRRPPAPGYLDFLGVSEETHLTHAGNEAAALDAGLVPLYSCTSSLEEWDHYEGLYLFAMERFLRDHPRDPDAASFQSRIRRWRDAYHRWGRDSLGFGFYLFGKPSLP